MGETTPDPKHLIEQLKLLVQHPDALNYNNKDRSEIQRLARLASVAVETQEESMHRIMFTYFPLVTARISHDFDIFTTLIKGDDADPVALSELIEASGLDKNLLSSITDYHCYQGAAVKPRQGFYKPTKLTYTLLKPQVVKATTSWHDILGPGYGAFHRLLKKGPDQNGQKTAFQAGQRTTDIYYDWLESHPEQHSAFYGYMAEMHVVAIKWLDVVPFDKEIAQDAQENEPVFVDVGGGDGSQCIEVLDAHKIGGRIILQDRATVIEKANKAREAGIETLVYDFFIEQPVKGARVYFFFSLSS